MQALTSTALGGALFLVVLVASSLTLAGSWVLIWRYRRGVAAAMQENGFGAVAVEPVRAASSAAEPVAPTCGVIGGASLPPLRSDAAALLERALHAPLSAARNSALAGLAFALVLAVAAVLAIPAARTPQRFLFTMWVDCWPIVVATAFTAPRFARWAVLGTVAYFAPFVGATLVALAFPEPPAESAELAVAALLDTITPQYMLRLWLVFGALPTAVLLLFLNPSTRAVSPLLLAFTTLLVSGCTAIWIGLFSPPVSDFVVHALGPTGRAGPWLLLGVLVLVILACGTLAWLALGWVKRAYVTKTISDRSLVIDALWLFFAAYFSTLFALQGPRWLLTGMLAFIACKLTFAWLRRHDRTTSAPLAPRGLTFLRVFALGPKSNALFDALAKHWRRIGSMQLITGPDVAHSVVQPHQLLDFVSGRLGSHFVADARTLEARMERRDRAPDRDGWYRINSFFCRADTWKAVLARLVGDGDVILMDLRSFSADNAGCVHELGHLMRFVPLGRCVFVVDASTRVGELRAVLREAWSGLGDDAPNRSIDPGAVVLHRVDSPGAALPELLRNLCAAG